MAEVFQRLLTTGGELAPGQWTATACRDVVFAKAVVCCRKCGGIDALDDEYEIAPDGRVTPRWRCPTATCGEESWLVLEAWQP